MKILIAGIDGYLGWSLAQHLTLKGHEVSGIDTFFRRDWVEEMKSQSALPILTMEARLKAFEDVYGKKINFVKGDLTDYDTIRDFLKEVKPDAIVHLAEVPSAPYSMMDRKHAVFTQQNNVIGNMNLVYAMQEVCPDAHLLKLGTMGEYGTPNIDIPEGFFEVEFRGRKDILPFPRQAHSWYHWSKVHDSNNIMYACKIMGLRSTDIMQGVVFGTRFENMPDDARLFSRFDFDQCFGTIINRFCAQAIIGHPLTVYGTGEQRRGMLPLKDSMQCLTLALENPPVKGEYRVFNQFEETYSLNKLADYVKAAAKTLDIDVDIAHYENPRTENPKHYFNPDHKHLLDLGYKPTSDIIAEIRTMLIDLKPYKARIEACRGAVVPDVTWAGVRRQMTKIDVSGQTQAEKDTA